MAHDAFVDQYLLYLLARASEHASAEFHQRLKAERVSVLNWRILASLSPDRELTIGQLAKHALSNQTTMTRAVDRMVNSGHLARVRSKADRRKVFVSLTCEGRKMAKKFTTLAEAHEASLLGATPPEEVAVLKSTLRHLIASH